MTVKRSSQKDDTPQLNGPKQSGPKHPHRSIAFAFQHSPFSSQGEHCHEIHHMASPPSLNNPQIPLKLNGWRSIILLAGMFPNAHCEEALMAPTSCLGPHPCPPRGASLVGFWLRSDAPERELPWAQTVCQGDSRFGNNVETQPSFSLWITIFRQRD